MRRCKIAHSPQLLHFAERPARVSRPLHKNLTSPGTVRNNRSAEAPAIAASLRGILLSPHRREADYCRTCLPDLW